MKAFFQKNAIHPDEGGNNVSGLPSVSQGEVISLIIPMTSELNYFERRLNNNQGFLPAIDSLNEWNNLVIRRYRHNSETDVNEPCKYEVLSVTGRLIYYISEQTEYFMKNSTCFSQPETKELRVVSPGDDSVIKFFAEFGATGFCNKIITKQHNRIIGTTYRTFFILPNTYTYSISDSKNKKLFKIKSKYFCKSGLLCSPSATENFEISFGKGRFAKGKIQRDIEGGESFLLSLFHGIDPMGKLLLISTAILIDLQTSKGKTGICKCDLYVCISQCVASICFYIFFLLLFITVIFVIAKWN